MKAIKIIVPILIIVIYILLCVFPVKYFYTYDDFDITPYNPSTVQVVHILKSFILFPGPRNLWLVRTKEGYIAYSKFNTSGKEKPVFSLGIEEVGRKQRGINDEKKVDPRQAPAISKDGYQLKNGVLTIVDVNLKSLESIKHLSFERLSLAGVGIDSLRGIEGKKIEVLSIMNTKISDLNPLKGIPLASLMCSGSAVNTITPLSGSSIQWLFLNDCPIQDITPIESMKKLNKLYILNCPVTDISPISRTNITSLFFGNKYYTRKIENGEITFSSEITLNHVKNDIPKLRKNNNFKFVNGYPSSRFWELYDNGKFFGDFSEMDIKYNNSKDLNDFILISAFSSDKDNASEIRVLNLVDARYIPFKKYRVRPISNTDSVEILDYDKQERKVLLKIDDLQGWAKLGLSKPIKEY